jgi:hypothetical protein
MKPPCHECLVLPICRSKTYKGIIGTITAHKLCKCSLIKDYIYFNKETAENRLRKVESILHTFILFSRYD